MARQRLGQHFLSDANWRQQIAQKIGIAGGGNRRGVWIEIGAGHGEMTELLAEAAERLVAIELDARLAPKLAERFSGHPSVTVVAGDVLNLDLAQLAGAGPFTVYGNLPYYITSPIVHQVLECSALRAAFLLMQLEVAERLLAPPGSRDRGYFSAFTQFYARPQILLRIPPGAFRPPPRVNSALVSLTPPGERARLGVDEAGAFVEFLKACFAQKRKMLRNNLRPALAAGRAAEAMERAGLTADARAEELTLEQLAKLFAVLHGEAGTVPRRPATTTGLAAKRPRGE